MNTLIKNHYKKSVIKHNVKEEVNTFGEMMISNWSPVPKEGTFPQANASIDPWSSSVTPSLAALRKHWLGLCRYLNQCHNRKKKLVEFSLHTEKQAWVKGAGVDSACLCLLQPLGFNATNSPVTERQSATRSRCSRSIPLPVSDTADSKSCNHHQRKSLKTLEAARVHKLYTRN